ncbi:hypothetical protein DPMN_171586 [Dreissena polymorpha]|uniref:Uncharacterized protein n=1 Tax=Dreissena polymorpha TaxID=45954 RepID=A0A9D4IFA2_DREPO|nr:hypothetical protein DPMN_171586 [Dreissena polymorpha]
MKEKKQPLTLGVKPLTLGVKPLTLGVKPLTLEVKPLTLGVKVLRSAIQAQEPFHFAHLRGTSFSNFDKECLRNVNATVFTNQMWTDRRLTKTNPKTSPEQSGELKTIFHIVREINKTNALTKFHDDKAKNVTSRVFTRKTAPPTGGHVFQRTETTFKLNQHINKANILTNFQLDRYIIGTNLLTNFHEDRTINVASRVFTNKCGRTTDGRTTHKDRSQK